MPKPRATAGRYENQRGVREPPGGFGQPVPSLNVRTSIGVVQDPYDPKLKIAATISLRVDVLEKEYAHRRISEGAYHAGRLVQAAFERMGGISPQNWSGGDRVDAAVAHELAIIRSLERGQKLVGLLNRIVSCIGMIDARLLRRVLADRQNFAQCAAAEGKGGDRGQNYIGQRFRDALELLADRWTAKGQGRIWIDIESDRQGRTGEPGGLTSWRAEPEASANDDEPEDEALAG